MESNDEKNIKPDPDLDANNKGFIEVGSKGRNKKTLLIISGVMLAIVFGGLALLSLTGKKTASSATPEKKEDESLLHRQSEDKGISSRMNEIMTLQARQKQAELEKQKKEAEEKKRAEEEKQEEEAEQKAEQKADAVAEIQHNTEAAGSTPPVTENTDHASEDRNKPLRKSQRILAGNSLIDLKKEAANNPPENDPDTDFLRGGSFAAGSVHRVKHREFTLSAGTVLRCVLKTKIITSYPGVTLCQVTDDVYSDDGRVLLIRKGAELTGTQTKVMAQGIARVFVNWTTIKDGDKRVRVDALGADGLGASGLPAWIDSHFWQRFGGAIMLSFIDDALDTAKQAAAQNQSGTVISTDNSGDAAKQMASIALQNSIDIPPTAYVNQGSLLSVIIPRNVDFSGVYEVSP